MSINCTISSRDESLKSRVVKALFLSIILVAALVLNLKTFLVLLKRKRHHRNVVTIFLLNLTLVSALMASQIPFNIHAIIEQEWVFGDGFCQFNGFSNVFLCMDLIFTLVCLTIDRYLAVVKPLQHRTIMTRRTAYRMLVVVNFLSFLLAVVPILTKARYKYHPGTNHCSPSWSNNCAYAVAVTTIAFVLPILGMFVTYTRIFLILKGKRINMSRSVPPTMSSKDIPNEDSINSLSNFEDTSTDPSGEDGIKLTAHKALTDANLDCHFEPGGSLENLLEKDSAIQHVTADVTARKITGRSKEKLVKNAVGVCTSSDHLEKKKSTIRHTTAKQIDCKMFEDLKENTVENDLKFGPAGKQLGTLSSDEYLPKVDLTVNDTEGKDLGDDSATSVGTHLEDKKNKHDGNKTGITSMDMTGTDQESLELGKKDNARTSLWSVVNNSINMPDKTNMANIDKAYTVPVCSVNGVAIPSLQREVSLDLPPTSTNNAGVFDREDTQTGNKKQVSFQNLASESKTEVKQEEKRSSSIFPVSRSRKAIDDLVNRMKKQRAIRHEYKIARTGTILLVSFLVLWMPYVIAHLCFVGSCRTMTLYNIATFLVYTNALANPIIYALTNKAVMQDIRKSMGRLCRSR